MVKALPGFSLLLTEKCEERAIMEGRMVKHKELGGDDFENFTKAKDAKIWKWLKKAGQTE